MRLWHKDLIGVLPRQQLLGQWRECCAIAKNIYLNNTPNHILVNKIMNYPIEHFERYSELVQKEMKNRGFKISDRVKNTFESNCRICRKYMTGDSIINILFDKFDELYRRLDDASDNPRRQYFDREMREVLNAYKEILINENDKIEIDER